MSPHSSNMEPGRKVAIMDAFEQIVAMLLDRDGYWTQTSHKVELTKAETVKIGTPSCPRWELDVIAYKPESNGGPTRSASRMPGSVARLATLHPGGGFSLSDDRAAALPCR